MRKYRILCVSDESVLYNYSTEVLKKKFKDVDFIMSAGDLNNHYLDYLVSTLDKDLIYVNGNHVYGKEYDISFCKNIGGKVIRYKGLKIMGLDGSRVYSFKEHQYTERQMFFKILKNWKRLIFGELDIVLSHAPPRYIHDCEDRPHKGFKVFRRAIRVLKPKIWVHGHIHLSSPYQVQETVFEGTKIINAYGYKIIELEK